jgi:hypothetical protein
MLPVSGWDALRDRWELFHDIRTWLCAAGLGFLIAADLADAEERSSMHFPVAATRG